MPLSVPVIKVVHVGTDFDLEEAEPFRGHAAALLLDTFVAGKAGGTSQTFDWQPVLARSPEGFLLSSPGGSPAQRRAHASPRCIRSRSTSRRASRASPGIKDPDKIAAFCAAVRAADQEG